MTYFSQKVGDHYVSVRDIEESDIPKIVRYWHESDHDYLQGIGVDVNKIVSEEVTASIFKRSLPKIREESDRIVLIFEIMNEVIGYTNVNFDKSGNAFAHVHIISEDYRKKNIVPSIFFKTIKVYLDNFNINEMFLQTNVNNANINKLLFRKDVTLLKTEFIDKPDGMGCVGTYNLFSCSRNQVEKNI